MINTDMRQYSYSTIGEEDAYGQQKIDLNNLVGILKMAINIAGQSIQDNINYENCQYIGLTRDKVDSNYIIHYGNEKLKVLYVNPKGRLNQIFMARM